MDCTIRDPAALPRPKVVSVNGTVIPREAIAQEVQYHPAAKPILAWQAAARALALRELLLQEARRLGVTAVPLTDSAGRRETDEEALVRGLIEQEVKTPRPDAETCRRYYEQNRKLFRSATTGEGWAHYCEQMMVEAGFRRGDHAFKLGQLSEALVRLARFVVAIRLHCEDLSVEQGMRFFRDEAFLEEATARREAERGTFDPTYLVYSVGKLMMLKLRRDFTDAQGGKLSMRAFHDAVLGQGNAPFWAHRRLLLGDASDAVLE